jgi:hypothetical protein
MPLAYHATARRNLQSIAEKGLNAQSYWAEDRDLAGYYASTVSDDRHDPVIITVEIDDLDQTAIDHDGEGIAEPIMSIVRPRNGLGNYADEDDAYELFLQKGGTVAASREVYGSFRYKKLIPADLLTVEGKPLLQYLGTVNSQGPRF